MKGHTSQAAQTLAALKAFGLVDYKGSGDARAVSVSDQGRTYLRAQQEEIKREVLKRAALRPKWMAYFWPTWGQDRPQDAICLDLLVFTHKFNPNAAPGFLKVYDETIDYAKLASSDKVTLVDNGDDEEDEPMQEATADHPADVGRRPPPPPAAAVPLAAGERVLTTGLLAKDASFKLIVSGRVGPKEIDILIRKLQLDKEILADPTIDDELKDLL